MMSLLLIPIFALIGPQSIDELQEVLPALHMELTVAEVRWLKLAERVEFAYT